MVSRGGHVTRVVPTRTWVTPIGVLAAHVKSSVGRIIRVELRNFMCHAHLVVDMVSHSVRPPVTVAATWRGAAAPCVLGRAAHVSPACRFTPALPCVVCAVDTQGPNVNVITGKNGSGKSAVCASIQVRRTCGRGLT